MVAPLIVGLETNLVAASRQGQCDDRGDQKTAIGCGQAGKGIRPCVELARIAVWNAFKFFESAGIVGAGIPI